MSYPIRVLIVEDNEVLREELRGMIEIQADMEIVGELRTAEHLSGDVRRLEPDVVVVGLAVPGGGLRALEQVARSRPETRVVVLALHDDISLLRSALALGALGYVVHQESRRELLAVVRKLHHGRRYVDVPTGGLRLDPGLDPDSAKQQELAERLSLLSAREREVLEAVAYGYTNREIAERIGIGVKSVETYRFRLGGKLDFKSRADLVRFALEAGLLRSGRDVLPPAPVKVGARQTDGDDDGSETD